MSVLPTGTVTFLFTDIQGSTKLWEEHPEAMGLALARHDTLLRKVIEDNEGVVFKTIGDAFCAAFATAPAGIRAALEAQQRFYAELWPQAVTLKVRMALHTGDAEARDNDYFGQPLNRVARLLATGSGGQTLLSYVTHDLVRDKLPFQTTLKDLGVHRLKDLARPEHVFQLSHPDLPEAFPALRSLNSAETPNNLPQQVTSFIGRQKEIEAVQQTLARSRLLTLTGSGGSGKSRLALQAAADLLETYPNGVWLVELAALTDPILVAQTVANVLAVSEVKDKPTLTTLAENLKVKQLLLILDNCEHVLSASAQLADYLIRSCPAVQILATSREGLGIAGEATYRVPSLSLPDPRQVQTAESLCQFEAVQLFIARALQTQPNFGVTDQNAGALAAICHRLDGIPLAIELAAARARSLSLEDINRKLDQRFRLLTGGSRTALPRQQTLRSLIDWSYDLLSEAEKVLLCRLSVFAGGWTLAAAEVVCSGGAIEEWETLDFLASLCDKSLIIAETSGIETRYWMMETIRQYARDRLVEIGDGAVYRDRHLAFFLVFGEELEPQINSPLMREILDRFEAELDNFRAAMEWSGASPEHNESDLRLILGMANFMESRGYWRELEERLSRAMEASAGVSPSVRAKGLYRLGCHVMHFPDFVTALQMLEESLEIRQGLGDRLGTAQSLSALGTLAHFQKDFVLARQCFEESLLNHRELGNQRGIAAVLNNLGNVASDQCDPTSARLFFEESLAITRASGEPMGIYTSLLNIGELSFNAKDYCAAELAWRECLAIAVQHTLKASTAWALLWLAGVIAVTDTPLKAARLWGLFERMKDENGGSMPTGFKETMDAHVLAARAELNDDAAFDAAWQEGLALSLEEAVALAQRETTQPLTFRRSVREP
jgi:predicted ATPase/class 3 adenylate cyclase